MKRPLICLLRLLALTMAVGGGDAGPAALAQTLVMPEVPELTVTMEPPHVLRGGAYVQGQLKLRVRLASKYPFEALDLRLPEIDGARVLTLSKPRSRKVRSYGGDGHVFETLLALFPQRSGPLRLLPIVVTGAVSKGGGETSSFARQSESLAIQVKPIDPGYGGDWWLVADSISMTESWSKPPDELRVGDLVRREVVVKAFGVTAEQMTKIEHGRTRGIAVTDAGAETRTELTPEGAIAHLRQAWDLRIEDDQVPHIGPLRVTYWDPVTASERHAAVGARRLEPLPRDVESLTRRLLAEARDAQARWRVGLIAAIASPAALILVVALMYGWAVLPTRRDRALRRACAGRGRLTDCYRAVAEWDRSSPRQPTINQIRQRFAGRSASKLDDLQSALFSAQGASAQPKEIADELVALARSRRLSALGIRLRGFMTYILGTRNCDWTNSKE